MGKQIKNRKVGKKVRDDLDESREDYTPSDTEESQEMHSNTEEDATPQYNIGKKSIKMERKEKKGNTEPK